MKKLSQATFIYAEKTFDENLGNREMGEFSLAGRFRLNLICETTKQQMEWLQAYTFGVGPATDASRRKSLEDSTRELKARS